MLDADTPRDLVMIGAVFGVAAFAWSGWAQEQPPHATAWRVVLGALGAGGLALAAWSILLAVGHWDAATALTTEGGGFRTYLVVFWVEVALAAAAGVVLARTGHSGFLAPLVLLVVGVHFVALAVVFGQPVLHLAAVLLCLAALVAAVLPSSVAAHSFWCGLLAAPVFLGIGLWCTLGGSATLTSG